MSEHTFEKDQKEYVIFRCKKCNQYSYVKKTQKTKKCLRCNRTHQVKKIRPDQIVKGMSKAVETVKRKQSELAIHEFQQFPEFRAKSDFSLTLKGKPEMEEKERNKDTETQLEYDRNYLKFIDSLKKISYSYKEVPYFMLKIICKRDNIPILELKWILKRAKREGSIKEKGNSYFRLNP